MKYNELIQIRQGFQASVNLEYDLNKIDKVRSYIPTEQSVKMLGAFLRSYYFNTEPQNRATVLIGPYGRGKSHLLLVLSALTSLDLRIPDEDGKIGVRDAQYELCDKIAQVDPETGALAKAIVDSNIRTLPVVINSNTTDINQAFLIAINDALRNAGLSNLLPTTYFDAALPVIEKWENSYKDMYAQLRVELRKHKTTIDALRMGLKQFNQGSYELFCKCHTAITSAEFNPLTNMDVVKLYLAVGHALQEQTGYCGITVIFDEFSKFLEANLDKSKMLNFKIIQDMAEAATRSGSNQLHFTCITHKDILDYSSSDSFKTVEGRFRKLRFVVSSEQSYELISNALIKSAAFTQFKNRYAKEFNVVSSDSARLNIFRDLTEEAYQEKLVYGCFPLTPVTAYALLHISELVGQNERTLFTFLSQNEPYALHTFLNQDVDGFSVITADYIYGYFEELFKKEIFNAKVHSLWAKTDSALRQTSDENQRKILKAIAVINMIGDEQIKPIPAHIKATLMMQEEVFAPAAKALQKLRVLSQKETSEYVLLTANGVDIQNAVDNFVKTRLPRINECDVLDKACDLGFVMPRAYNDRYGMTRCFKNIYMDANVFLQYRNAEQLLDEHQFDGLIIHMLCRQETGKVLEKIRAFESAPQIVLCLSQIEFSHELLLKQYEAATKLLDGLEIHADPHYREELEVHIEDLRRRIRNVVSEMYSPASVNRVYINCTGELSVSRQADLNKVISAICTDCYSMTPVVNNEMVNKRKLNTQNTKARDLVVDWLLRDTDEAVIPCMPGYGPEVSIFKSAIKHKGLDASTEVSDVGMNAVLKVISDFIAGCEKERGTFSDLYKTLTAPPYGMRKGIIPLYIAYAMRTTKQSIILYFKDKEVELSASALSHLNENPEQYHILLETSITERNGYLDALQTLFKASSGAEATSTNRIYAVVRNMQNWMRAFPEYTKKHKYSLESGELTRVPSTIDAVRNELLRFDINARELLFDVWPRQLSTNDDLALCFEEIAKVKKYLDAHITMFRTELTRKLISLFNADYQGGLTLAVMNWYKSLPEATTLHLFDADTNSLLVAIRKHTGYDDDKLLDELVYAFAVIAIEDWNDRQAEIFIEKIAESIAKVNGFTEAPVSDTQDGKLSVSVDGTHIEKVFSADTITPLGKTVLNNLKSVFEDYNDALEPEEQLAILAKLIGEIIH